MEEPVDFQEWEFLQTAEVAGAAENLKTFSESEVESDDGGAIKSDYFALDSDARYPKRAALGGEVSEEEGLTDSDNPSWVDPESDSRYLDQPKVELGLAGIGIPRRDSGGFWSDESLDGPRFSKLDGEKGELVHAEDSRFGLGFEGIEDGHQNSDGEEAKKDASFGGIGEIGGGEMENEKPSEIGSDASAERGKKSMISESVSVGREEKTGMVWWKLPLEMLRFCVFRVKPVWSISIGEATPHPPRSVPGIGRILFREQNTGGEGWPPGRNAREGGGLAGAPLRAARGTRGEVTRTMLANRCHVVCYVTWFQTTSAQI